MKHPFIKTGLALGVVLALSACGGGGSGNNDSDPNAQLNDDGETLSDLTRGFALPSEISAVPTDTSDAEARSVTVRGLGGALRALTTSP